MKEQLEPESELAATTAKVNVLEILGSGDSSTVSDGMNSYLTKATAQSETSPELNPNANVKVHDT